jgi:hypothetical protein
MKVWNMDHYLNRNIKITQIAGHIPLILIISIEVIQHININTMKTILNLLKKQI